MKTSNRRISFFNIITLTLLILALFPAMSGNAASKKTVLSAYEKFLTKSTIMILSKGTPLGNYYSTGYQGTESSDTRFALAYLDKDKVPELILMDGRSGLNVFAVFSYKKGKVARVCYSNLYEKPIAYYRGRGYFYSFWDAEHEGKSYSYYKLYTGAEGIVLRRIKWYEGGSVYYKCKGTFKSLKSISSSKFKSLNKKYTGGKKATKINFYKNTSANRKKYLK